MALRASDRGRCRSEVLDNAPSGGWVWKIKVARKRIPPQWHVDALSASSANRNLRLR